MILLSASKLHGVTLELENFSLLEARMVNSAARKFAQKVAKFLKNPKTYIKTTFKKSKDLYQRPPKSQKISTPDGNVKTQKTGNFPGKASKISIFHHFRGFFSDRKTFIFKISVFLNIPSWGAY